MSSYDLTICIVSYNNKDLVAHAISSIQKQTKDISYQIILVDNASKDGTAEMVETTFAEVIVIRNNKNTGFSSATNLAIPKSNGRYFVLFNADAYLKNNALYYLVKFMDQYPACGIACPQLYYPDERLQRSHYPFRYPKSRALWEVKPRINELKRLFHLKPEIKSTKDLQLVTKPIAIQRPRGVCFMIRKTCIHEIGPMDDQYFLFSEEVDWAWRARKAGWKRYLVPSSQVYHINHASVSKNASLMEKIHMQSDYYYFKKHFGLVSQFKIRFGNLVGSFLAFILGLLTFLFADKKSNVSSRKHFSESKALLKLSFLMKKIVPPDAL